MRHGLSAGPLPSGLLYGDAIERACYSVPNGASPLVAYSIAMRETIRVEKSGWIAAMYPGKNACTVVSPDGGYGLFHPTPSATGFPLPENWQDPFANCVFVLVHNILPAEERWAARGIFGIDLARCIAAEFNAGESNAEAGHALGNVDTYTTGHNYCADIAANYQRLLMGQQPR